VGESGSGKTTLALAALRLEPVRGRVVFMGRDLVALSKRDMRRLRARMQIVFQDPYGSLSPRMTVGDIVGEGLAVHEPGLSRVDRDRRVMAALEEVGLTADQLARYPHEFSGGQRQRIASALDMSVQAQIIELLRDLRGRHNLAYLFISHDLKIVRALAHRVVVLRDGRIVEEGPADAIFDAPREEYTRSLMQAAFDLDRA
jgi:microcin C transport system ATP-binding protein